MNGAAREREKREVNGGPRTREGMGGRTREGGGYTPRVGLDGQNAPVECEKKHLQTDLPSADPTMEKREKTNKQTLFSVTSLYQTKPSNARPSRDWQGWQGYFAGLKISQAQPVSKIALLANSRAWALLAGIFG